KLIREVCTLTLLGAKYISETLPAGLVIRGCFRPVLEVRALYCASEGMQLRIQPSRHPAGLKPRLFYPTLQPWPVALVNAHEDEDEFVAAISAILGPAAAAKALRERTGNAAVTLPILVTVHELERLGRALAARSSAPTGRYRFLGADPAPKPA